ncbi:hypothetical protein Trydic_g10225 [Trypoxylus dichotomus]
MSTLTFQYNITVYMKQTKDEPTQTPLVSLYEEDACVALEKYIGQLMVPMQKAAGMEPGKCPIAEGTYIIKDHELDFSSVPTAMLPIGYFQITQAMVHKTTKEEVFCGVTEGSHLSV